MAPPPNPRTSTMTRYPSLSMLRTVTSAIPRSSRNELRAMGFSSSLIDRAMEISDCGSVEDLASKILAMQEHTSLEDIFRGKLSEEMIANARKECGANAQDSAIADYIFSQHPDLLRAEEASDKHLHGRLKSMGFSDEQIANALGLFGNDAKLEDVVEHIFAKEAAPRLEEKPDLARIYREWDEESRPGSSSRRVDTTDGKRKREDDTFFANFDDLEDNFDGFLPEQRNQGDGMGFGIPGQPPRSRTLPSSSLPPPFFYFENVAIMPRGSWEDITRFLDGIEPELVNSKWFCAASRPRGYVHNLPVKGRRALPPGPMTIQELVPGMENVRPPWDKRVKLNCITTSSDRAARVQASAEAFYNDDDVDPQVFLDMKRANLVWRGRGILAPLEVQELEVVQGFDVGHTSSGQSPAERIKALGNAMQVHTVAWHLSVLAALFPTGIRVLSLFSGIGGIEVALEKLGIPIKFLVSVETNADCHRVLRSWWHRTRQRGTHIVLGDVTELSRERIEELAARAGGGFDLVAGGSPCNNFSGNNRTSRTGITGDKSRLFFDYVRILTTVRSIMAKSAS
ncbi:DNA (cytosine-5)-methyltransferase DRM1A isoform X2 [Selaginella moellendorffii]|uniref:DNA (cytosine-5)-methyltransferase DRM1A isoform X2 n=1 Tax=Selaginella moellendorffii TaxID=88036 RepID=UPI000D1C5F76|nr:DNA (cytosine-5)-methyltransferase DRM1A isoform X2 [Selaginella moellendorffii]|eukprot:XP_024539212.1 DNA (cytosine-5)-methyltransferase DRM1A isoform X2 [Selaginella moellendorffii]